LHAGSATAPDGEIGVIDAHVHIFPPELIARRESYLDRDARFGELYRSPSAKMAGADQLLASMDAERVSQSVVVGFPFADQGLCRLLNDYVLEAMAEHPGRLAGLACVAPQAPGASAEVERCLDAGMRGCGELAPQPGERLDSVAGLLRERQAPLLVHASEPVGHEYPGKGRFGPEDCFALARSWPGLTIVFAHFGGGLFLYETMAEVRDALAGVFYDTAAAPYLYDARIYQAVASTAGPGKLLFGSDYPLLPPARYNPALEVLPSSQREAVVVHNARKVFGL